MNITLKEFNRFIDAEKRKELLSRETFQTVAESSATHKQKNLWRLSKCVCMLKRLNGL